MTIRNMIERYKELRSLYQKTKCEYILYEMNNINKELKKIEEKCR